MKNWKFPREWGKQKELRVFLGLLYILVLTTCGHKHTVQFFADPGFFEKVRVVGVISLENLTEHPEAGNVVTDLLIAELHRLDLYRVIGQTEMSRVFQEKDINLPKVVDRAVAVEVGRRLKADAMFIGSVTEFQYQSDYDPKEEEEEPVVGINLRLISTRTGTVIWGCSHAQSSYEVFSYEKDALTRVTIKALKNMLKPLSDVSG